MTEYIPCGNGPWMPYGAPYGAGLRVWLSDVRTYRVTGWRGRFDRPWRIYIADVDDYDTEAFYATEEAAMAALAELREAPITPERLAAMGFS